MSADEWWASSDVSAASLADYEILSRPSDDDDELGESAMIPIDTDTGSMLSSLSGDSSSSASEDDDHNSILEHTLEDVQQVQAFFDSQHHTASTHGLYPSGTPPLPVRNLLANSDSLTSWTAMITSWWTKPEAFDTKARDMKAPESGSVDVDVEKLLKKYETTPLTYMASHERGYHSYLRVSPLGESVSLPEALLKKKAVNLLAFGDVTKSDNSLFVSLAKPLVQLDQHLLVWCYSFDENTGTTTFAGVVSETSSEFHSTRPSNVSSHTWNSHQHLAHDLSTVGFIYYGANTSVLPLEKYYLYLKSTNTPAFTITNRPVSSAMNPHLLSSTSGPINVYQSGKNHHNEPASELYFPITRKQVMNMAGSHLMPDYLNLFELSLDKHSTFWPTALEFFNSPNEIRSSQITLNECEIEKPEARQPPSLKKSSDFAYTFTLRYQHFLFIFISLCLLPLYILNQDSVKTVNLWSPETSYSSHPMIVTSISDGHRISQTTESSVVWSTGMPLISEDTDQTGHEASSNFFNGISLRQTNAMSSWVYSKEAYSYVESFFTFFGSFLHSLYNELIISPLEAIFSLFAEGDFLKIQAGSSGDVKRLEGAEYTLKKTSAKRSSRFLGKGTPTGVREFHDAQSGSSLMSGVDGVGGLKTVKDTTGLTKNTELSVTGHVSDNEGTTVRLGSFTGEKFHPVHTKQDSSWVPGAHVCKNLWESSSSKLKNIFQRATSEAEKTWSGTKQTLSGHVSEERFSEKAHNVEQLGRKFLDRSKDYGRSISSESAKYWEYLRKNTAEQEKRGYEGIVKAADAGTHMLNIAGDKLGTMFSAAANKGSHLYSATAAKAPVALKAAKERGVKFYSSGSNELPQLWSWAKIKGFNLYSAGLKEAPEVWSGFKARANILYSLTNKGLPSLIRDNRWFSAVSSQAVKFAHGVASAGSWKSTDRFTKIGNGLKQKMASVRETSAYKGTRGRL